MKPGIVLTSIKTGPEGVRKKSIRASERHPNARYIVSAASSMLWRSVGVNSAGIRKSAAPPYFSSSSNRPPPATTISNTGPHCTVPSGRSRIAISTSRPMIRSSISTRRSNRCASRIAPCRSAGSLTSTTPCEEPAATGLTTAGSATPAGTSSSCVMSRPGATAMPWEVATERVAHLSIATALATSGEKTQGMPASSARAAIVPSSPAGPCIAGNSTSTPSSTSSVRARDSRADAPSGSPSHSHRPLRVIRTSRTRWPQLWSAARMPSAEASDTSCSEDVPPPITATSMVPPPRPCALHGTAAGDDDRSR